MFSFWGIKPSEPLAKLLGPQELKVERFYLEDHPS